MYLRHRGFDLRKPLLVGILNVTPDSFSDGGQLATLDQVLRRAEELMRDGADLLDLGGESTRPHAAAVSPTQEAERVLPAVEALARRLQTGLKPAPPGREPAAMLRTDPPGELRIDPAPRDFHARSG